MARYRSLLITVALGYFVWTLGYRIWESTFNNFAVEEIGVNAAQIGLVHAIREAPGLLGFLAGFLALALTEFRLAHLSLTLMGVGILLTAQVHGFPALVAAALLMSTGFHFFMPANSSLVLMTVGQEEAPRVLGRLNSLSAAASVIGTHPAHLRDAGPVGIPESVPVSGGRRHRVCPAPPVLPHAPGPRPACPPPGPSAPPLLALLHPAGPLRQPSPHLHHLRRLPAGAGVPGLCPGHHSPLPHQQPDGHPPEPGLREGRRPLRRTVRVDGQLRPAGADFQLILLGLFVADNVLFNFSFALDCYFQKIALDRGEITPNVALGQTFNHVAAVVIPIVGGLIWETVGPQYTFGAGILIALACLGLTQWMRVPRPALCPAPTST